MTATYDPTRVSLVWGLLPITGFADGTMINVTPQGDGVRAITGTAGETAFIETPNRQHEVEFRLMETAGGTPLATNTALVALFEAGNLPAPMTLTSVSTGATMAAGAAKLERVPGTTYDNNMPVRAWKLIIPKMGTAILPAP